MKIKELEDKYMLEAQELIIAPRARLAVERGLISPTRLHEAYQKVTRSLNKTYEAETIRTRAERYLHQLLRESTGEDIKASMWIGNHCVDLFIPRIGLAIEVDGDIHDNEMKMRKDELKEEFLAKLGIMVWHINNNEIRRRAVDIKNVLEHPKTKEKDINALLNTIYVETIGAHLDSDELSLLIYYSDNVTNKRRVA